MEAGWMLAIRAELKAGQQIILNQLLQTKSAKHFVKARNNEVVKQVLPPDKKKGSDAVVSQIPKDDVKVEQVPDETSAAVAAEEEDIEDVICPVDKAKKRLNFDLPDKEDVQLKQCSILLSDISTFLTGKAHLALTEVKKEPPENYSELGGDDGDFLALHPELKECSVLLHDVQNHSWWGSKIQNMKADLTKIQKPKITSETNDGQQQPPVRDSSSSSDSQTEPVQDLVPTPPDGMEIVEEPPKQQEAEIKTEKNSESNEQIPCGDTEKDDDMTQAAEITSSSGKIDITETKAMKEIETEQQKVLDLTGLASNVEAGVYQSVLYFHLDFKRVCSTVHVPGKEYIFPSFYFSVKSNPAAFFWVIF